MPLVFAGNNSPCRQQLPICLPGCHFLCHWGRNFHCNAHLPEHHRRWQCFRWRAMQYYYSTPVRLFGVELPWTGIWVSPIRTANQCVQSARCEQRPSQLSAKHTWRWGFETNDLVRIASFLSFFSFSRLYRNNIHDTNRSLNPTLTSVQFIILIGLLFRLNMSLTIRMHLYFDNAFC